MDAEHIWSNDDVCTCIGQLILLLAYKGISWHGKKIKKQKAREPKDQKDLIYREGKKNPEGTIQSKGHIWGRRTTEKCRETCLLNNRVYETIEYTVVTNSELETNQM